MTLDEAFDVVVEKLEQELRPRWIPVTERLPEEDGTYLVSQLVYSPNEPRGYGYEPSKNEVDFVQFSVAHGWRRAKELYEITAWMLLPKPYVPDINVRNMLESEDKE